MVNPGDPVVEDTEKENAKEKVEMKEVERMTVTLVDLSLPEDWDLTVSKSVPRIMKLEHISHTVFILLEPQQMSHTFLLQVHCMGQEGLLTSPHTERQWELEDLVSLTDTVLRFVSTSKVDRRKVREDYEILDSTAAYTLFFPDTREESIDMDRVVSERLELCAECEICLSSSLLSRLSCGHTYCSSCLHLWLSCRAGARGECPALHLPHPPGPSVPVLARRPPPPARTAAGQTAGETDQGPTAAPVSSEFLQEAGAPVPLPGEGGAMLLQACPTAPPAWTQHTAQSPVQTSAC